MDADIFRELFPQQYIQRFLSNGIRPDGRNPTQPRQVLIEYADQIINYSYGSCFISTKYTIKLTEHADIKLTYSMDHPEELGHVDKQRIDNYYICTLQDIITNNVDTTNLLVGTGKAYTIDISIRVSSADGSLLSHLINILIFTLSQICLPQPDNTITKLTLKEVKCQTFSNFQGTYLIDPSLIEEKQGSSLTVMAYLDEQTYQIIKTDGKPLKDIDFKYIQSQMF